MSYEEEEVALLAICAAGDRWVKSRAAMKDIESHGAKESQAWQHARALAAGAKGEMRALIAKLDR